MYYLSVFLRLVTTEIRLPRGQWLLAGQTDHTNHIRTASIQQVQYLQILKSYRRPPLKLWNQKNLKIEKIEIWNNGNNTFEFHRFLGCFGKMFELCKISFGAPGSSSRHMAHCAVLYLHSSSRHMAHCTVLYLQSAQYTITLLHSTIPKLNLNLREAEVNAINGIGMAFVHIPNQTYSTPFHQPWHTVTDCMRRFKTSFGTVWSLLLEILG